MEVPDKTAVAVLESIPHDRMSLPGANIRTPGPKFEKLERASKDAPASFSSSVVDPTVMTLRAPAGEQPEDLPP
jgi:hypothetical protein